jgi:serine protease Do
MTTRRLRLVCVLGGLAGVALALAVTRPFARAQGVRPAATTPPVATSGSEAVAAARRSEPVSGPLDAQTIRRIAEAQTPMVVNIRSEARRRREAVGDYLGGDDPFRRFFGLPETRPSPPGDDVLEGAGSGFIIDTSGLILTNNHVVAGASRIDVGFFAQRGQNDRQTYRATVIGRDPLTDSALIRIVEALPAGLPTATFGDSAQVAPGDWVVAIGNPFNLTHTVTAGVISARERPFPVEGRIQEMLQTDAAINPGNSGGPLLNLRGEVIGINTAILSTGPTGGNVGIGFAVPINVVRDLLPQLQDGKVTRGRMGVRVTDVPREAVEALGLPEQSGALVESIEPKGPAARAGLEPGDVIVGYGGTPVRRSDELVRAVASSRPGSRMPVQIVRDRRPMTFDVPIEALEFVDERRDGAAPQEASQEFGMSLGAVAPEMARQLQLPGGDGVVVTAVAPRSAAARAGLAPGDVILEVNRRRVSQVDAAVNALRRVPPGGAAFVLITRGGQQHFLTLTRPA